MSLIYQTRPREENNIYDLKKINDSMSEKIRQNQKQKALLVNQNVSNISSGIISDKRNIYNKSYFNEEGNSGIFKRNASQSSLSVDLNRFKINPNNFNNNLKTKENNTSLYINNNNNNINLDENFETFNPGKNKIVSIKNNTNKIININNNENIENSSVINNSNNININNKEEQKHDAHSLLKNFNPYDIKNFLGKNTSSKQKIKKKMSLVNNIPPSTSNLQMILYNKKMEDVKKRKNPDILFKEFYQKESRRLMAEYIKVLYLSKKNSSIKEIMNKENINQMVLLKQIKEKENNELNNTINNQNKSNDNSFLSSNRKNDPFAINESLRSNPLVESSSKKLFHEQNSFKLLNNFLNDMDDESKDKITLLTFLSIPRIMNLVITKDQKYSFVFYCSPTNISCLYGIETYIFKWNECKNFNLAGYFDLINVENCYLNNDNRKMFEIVLNNSSKNNSLLNNYGINESNHYSIETNDEETAINYVHAIVFISQLVKYRIYLNKKKEGKGK